MINLVDMLSRNTTQSPLPPPQPHLIARWSSQENAVLTWPWARDQTVCKHSPSYVICKWLWSSKLNQTYHVEYYWQIKDRYYLSENKRNNVSFRGQRHWNNRHFVQSYLFLIEACMLNVGVTQPCMYNHAFNESVMAIICLSGELTRGMGEHMLPPPPPPCEKREETCWKGRWKGNMQEDDFHPLPLPRSMTIDLSYISGAPPPSTPVPPWYRNPAIGIGL